MEAANAQFKGLEKDEIELTKKVDNPQNVHSYNKKVAHPLSSEYDLLILTTDELKGSFKPLKDAHNANGISTEIKTLKDISMIPGLIKPKDIRDFIRDEYSKRCHHPHQ